MRLVNHTTRSVQPMLPAMPPNQFGLGASVITVRPRSPRYLFSTVSVSAVYPWWSLSSWCRLLSSRTFVGPLYSQYLCSTGLSAVGSMGLAATRTVMSPNCGLSAKYASRAGYASFWSAGCATHSRVART
jgi:hypothetical protein